MVVTGLLTVVEAELQHFAVSLAGNTARHASLLFEN